MECENYFCVYWRNEKCILDKIRINGLGMCDECIMVNIKEEVLDAEKKRYLEKGK